MTRTRARSDEKSSPKVVKSRVFDQLSVVVWNNFSSMFSVAISSGDCSPSRMVSRAPGGRPDDGWRSSRDPPPPLLVEEMTRRLPRSLFYID